MDTKTPFQNTGEFTGEKTVVGAQSVKTDGSVKPILVVQTAFLGDVVLSHPLLKRIRHNRPEAPLFVVVRKGLGPLLKELGVVDGFFEIEKGQGATYSKLAERLSQVHFDWIVCPHGSVRSALFVWKLKAQKKFAFKVWWNGFFFSNIIDRNEFLPEPLRLLGLLKNVDIELGNLLRDPQLIRLHQAGKQGELPLIPQWATVDLRSRILSWVDPFSIQAPFVCVFPGSVWATKKWTTKGFEETGKVLAAQGLRIVWMGSKDEVELCAQLEKAVPGSVSLSGKTSLAHTLAVLARAQGVISNDSGGQHLAALAGVPILSIFGPTTLDLGFRPWSNSSAVVEKRGLHCRPCGLHGHKKCPIGTHECMTGIPSSAVIEAYQALSSRCNP